MDHPVFQMNKEIERLSYLEVTMDHSVFRMNKEIERLSYLEVT